MPRALLEKPDLDGVLAQYVEAFSILSHFRDQSGVLSFPDLKLYAEEIGDDVLDFTRIMVIADSAYIKAIQESKDLSLEDK